MSHTTAIYRKSLLQTKVVLAMAEVGRNVQDNLIMKMERKYGGKCIRDGYIQPKSIELVSHSSGNILGEYIEFHVVYHCNVCNPDDDMELECLCKTVTKAGVHAQVIDKHGNAPITVFVAREHEDGNAFQNMKEGDVMRVRVLGQRFELNDDCICVIAILV